MLSVQQAFYNLPVRDLDRREEVDRRTEFAIAAGTDEQGE